MAIINAKLEDNGHLIFIKDDGTTVDAGNVRGMPGPQGEKGIGIKGDPGEPGKDGKDGNASGPVLISTNASGDEGGEIQLAKAPNSSLGGSVTIDVYQNKLRIFEQGSPYRGLNIDLSKMPSSVAGELVWKAAGYVDAGQFVTLDNLKFTVTTSGSRGLSCATVSGTAALNISGTFGYVNGVGGGATTQSYTYTTTPSSSWFGWSFPNAGDGSVYLVNDTTNQRFYRVTLMIGPSYTKNFISIERLY
jgi:hypothetical protein